MTIRLTGSTSGYTEIDAPAVAGSNTLVLPTGNGSADQALVTNGSGALSFADRGRMVLDTAKSATGTEVDFTGIPSWVKRVTVMFSGVSTSGTSNLLVQLGDSGGVETSSYTSSAYAQTNVLATSTAGFILNSQVVANTDLRSGSLAITTITTNAWVLSGAIVMTSSGQMTTCSGTKTLSSTLDRIRITTVNGTDTFDAGTINILMEG